ncbi:MAG: xanthine dehydrogenase family protein molybdopterin-binding subunit [Acidimicrobiales bacterium]
MTGTYRPGSVLRSEDQRLTTGRGRYVANLEAHGMVHAVFVRSDIAHGTIRSLNLDSARQHPGVLAVFTGPDLALPNISSVVPPVPVAGMSRPVLAHERVRHVGEAVAMLVAESPTLAADASDTAWADIEPLPAVIDPRSAISSRPPLHPATSSNVVEQYELGDRDSGWGHPVDITVTAVNQRLAPVTMEPLSILAVPGPRRLRVFVGHQSPHILKRQLKELLDLDVEVVVTDVGGGFGTKARIYPEYVAVAAAAHRLGRPVRWLQSRSEQLLTGTHGRDMVHTVRLGGARSGRIERAHFDILAAVGAYPHLGAQVATFSRLVAQGLYDIETVTISSTTVVTNTAPIAPYRGAGRPEAAYAIERAVDKFARAAGLEPLDIRRSNVFPRAGFPHRTVTGALYDSGDYRAALDESARLLDLPALRAEQKSRRKLDDLPIGVGFGAFIERAGGAADAAEFAKVEVSATGDLVVYTGSTSNGQGHETVWCQVAGQVFDVDIDHVEFVAGDTERVPRGSGSTASRSAQIGASGIWRTASRVRAAAETVAAQLLEVAVEDLRVHDGLFHVAGVPATGVTLAEIASAAPELGVALSDEEWYSPGAQTFPYGVHAAVVEVDPEVGQVRILRYVAVEDCGNVLNPMIVEGQTHGSVAQGIGQALYESVEYRADGQLLTGTLLDYLVPGAPEIPPISTGRIVSPAPSNPLGVKGAGEGGCIGAPPAIVNAVLDALEPWGVRDIDMPLHPERVWRAIHEGQARTSVSSTTNSTESGG